MKGVNTQWQRIRYPTLRKCFAKGIDAMKKYLFPIPSYAREKKNFVKYPHNKYMLSLTARSAEYIVTY